MLCCSCTPVSIYSKQLTHLRVPVVALAARHMAISRSAGAFEGVRLAAGALGASGLLMELILIESAGWAGLATVTVKVLALIAVEEEEE